MSRVPAALLRNTGQPPTGQDLADVFQWLRANPLVQGRLLEGLVTDGTSATQYFNHGLGRGFRGVILTGISTSTAVLTIYRSANVSGAGRDPSKVFAVNPSTSVVVTFDAWVF